MPSYLHQLRRSKEKATVAYQEFALSTKSYEDYLFCFFEGDDNPYYVPRIKKHTEKIYPINCGGREKVLKVFELIKNQSVYSKYLKAFFIDRDFNKPIEEKDNLIFETPCYSIENLYVNANTFEDIITHDFHLSKNDSDFDVCISLFNKRFKEFNTSVSLFNSWYACLIEIRNDRGLLTGVLLEEKLPKGYVSISLQSVTSDYDLEKIKQTFPEAINIEDDVLDKKNSQFQHYDGELIFRGKYQMEFLISLLQLIVDDSKQNQEYIKNKINFAFDGALNHKRALSIFSNYAKTPDTLDKFLSDVTGVN